MIATKIYATTFGITTALAFAIPPLFPDPPIVVHSLVYDGGRVTQDRTVTSEGDTFYANWAAIVVDAAGIPKCSGDGNWAYSVGRRGAEMSLSEWTGDKDCGSKLIPGQQYRLKASWFWGDDQTSATSAPFIYDGVSHGS